MENKERIAKFIASSGLCSRRDAEKLIYDGLVKVDGQILQSPALNIDPDLSIVEVNGQEIRAKEKIRLWIYHKPVGLITTHKDPENRLTVFDSLKGLPRVISIGRLDINSEGLLLLTNDGDLARKMESPKTKLERVYKVRAYGAINQALRIKNKRLVIDGATYHPKLIEPMDDKASHNKWYRVVLCEGKNREIRKIFASFGLEVNRLIRISYGSYELGNLKAGEYREVVIDKEQSFK